MKKILFAIALITSGSAYAITMCVHSDSYVATLVKSRDGVSTSIGNDGKFTVTFDYYTSSLNTRVLDGIAACNEASGTTAVADGTLSTSTTDEGINCWCGMTMPLVSDWVYSGAYSSDSECASNCATACANAVKTSTAFRTAMFEAVW